MDSKYIANMYSSTPIVVASKPVVAPEKRATRVLGGMKIHGSHIKNIEVDGEIIDIPRAAYIKLLEEQIKELRRQVTIVTERNIRMNTTIQRMQTSFRDEIRAIRLELDRKIDMR